MKRPLLGLALATACGGSQASAPIANRGPKSPFDQTDFVVLDGGDLRFYSLARDRATEVMKVHLADNVDPSWMAMNPHSFDWIDRDRVIAAMGKSIMLVGAGGPTPIATPPDEAMTAPKPAKADGLEPGGALGLVVADGEAWWTACAWGFPADGFQCSLYVQVRVWPSPARRVGEALIQSRSGWDWTAQTPKGFGTGVRDNVVYCQPPNAPATEIKSDDSSDMVGDADVHWVSVEPPRLLVQYGGFGMTAFQTQWALHDGCNPTPIERGNRTEAGPAGLWIATGSDRVTLRRGARVIAELPSSDVRFRPAK